MKILEAIPGWKAVIGLPKRLAELEARVKALEAGKAAHARPRVNDCPQCGAVMMLTDETDHPHFGPMGVKVHSFKCDGCGRAATRDWTPGSGYS